MQAFFFQTPGEVSPNFSIEREPSKRIHVVRDEIDKDSIDFQTRYSMARSLDKIGKAAQNREKQEWAKEKPKLDNARKLRECTSSIRMTQSIQILSKKKKKNARKTGKTDHSSHAPQARQSASSHRENEYYAEQCSHGKEFKTICGCLV